MFNRLGNLITDCSHTTAPTQSRFRVLTLSFFFANCCFAEPYAFACVVLLTSSTIRTTTYPFIALVLCCSFMHLVVDVFAPDLGSASFIAL